MNAQSAYDMNSDLAAQHRQSPVIGKKRRLSGAKVKSEAHDETPNYVLEHTMRLAPGLDCHRMIFIVIYIIL